MPHVRPAHIHVDVPGSTNLGVTSYEIFRISFVSSRAKYSPRPSVVKNTNLFSFTKKKIRLHILKTIYIYIDIYI